MKQIGIREIRPDQSKLRLTYHQIEPSPDENLVKISNISKYFTALAPPERLFVTDVSSTSAVLRWESIRYQPDTGDDDTVRYLAEITNLAGGLRGSKLVVNERAVRFRDLIPGTSYRIDLYVSISHLFYRAVSVSLMCN